MGLHGASAVVMTIITRRTVGRVVHGGMVLNKQIFEKYTIDIYYIKSFQNWLGRELTWVGRCLCSNLMDKTAIL